MRRRYEVIIHLKDGLADPQGKAVEDALPTMGYTSVSDVKVGKSVTLTVDAETGADAEAQVQEIATRLLSNPVIERFTVRALEDA